MDVDRVQIWQNEVIDGELYFILKYESLSEVGRKAAPVPMGLKFPYSAKAEWKKKFLRNECINSPLCDLIPEDQEFLKNFDIKSIVIIPLFLQDQFWGFFSVDDCRCERVFSEEEINAFTSMSLMVASAVNRHVMASKIREADKLTQIMIDAMPYCCLLFDHNFARITCNHAAIDLYKLANKQEYLDRFDDFSPEYQPCGRKSYELSREWFKEALEKGYKRFEWQHRTLNGVLFPSEVTLVRVKFRDEDIVAAYVRDLTEHKAMLAEMLEAEDNLRLARDAAEAASLAKSAFLANMSHEIRTPMNSIIGFSELAMDDEILSKTRDYLNKIKENSQWLLQIINDILDISKIESGKMELEKIPFDLHELFISCRSLVMPKAVEKGLILHFYTEPSIGKKPLGDPTRLRQVLVNLLSNAIKFTNIGMIKVHADVKKIDEKTVTMYFEVRDSGIGMTKEQMGKVFEPFIQAETGTTRKYGGTGLGLTITKNLVELMGGDLWVESTPEVGSKFGFELTFDMINVSDEDMLEKKVIFNELEKPIFEGEILLCEDNVMNQQVIYEHLARIGLKAVVAENGKVGVELVKSRKKKGEKQFDLIFMDIHMPVMDGLEASDKIFELDLGIPIIAMTANIMATDREIYKNSGMSDCVSKPFTSHELWRCLMKYFKPVSWQPVNGTMHSQAEEELRHRLIKNFFKDSQNRFSEITQAIKDGDIKFAHRMAHTLKGNAGQLGKTLLQQAAADVESQLKEGKNLVTPEQMAKLEKELNAVLTDFAPLAKEGSEQRVATQAEFLDVQSAIELIEKLEPMLERGNPECRNFIDKLLLIPGSDGFKNQLVQQIDDLDFQQAIVTLDELKKGLK